MIIEGGILAGIFEVDQKDIQNLNDLQLTKLLKKLLSLEAKNNNIPLSSIDVSLNITVGDGGEDGRIKWEGPPASTNWLPKSFVLFQCKATNMPPGNCKTELLIKNSKSLKPRVEEIFDSNGSYILFYGRSCNSTQKRNRICKFKEAITESGKPYYESADIRIYDSNNISEWVNMYIPAVTVVCNWINKPLPVNFQTWDSWNGYQESKFNYVSNNLIQGYISQLRSYFSGSKKIARIIGLSGLGKTRLALEVFRPPENPIVNPDQQVLSDLVVYVDAETIDPSLLISTLMELRNRSKYGILVIDNCDLSLHQKLCKEINHINCNFSILTLDFNPDENCECELIRLEPVSDDVIKGIITQSYNNLGDPDASRIVEFSMGFPKMAVLLAEARLNEEQTIGNLSNNILVRKLLWGREHEDQTALGVISACALFKNLGFTEDVSLQRKYVAEKICNINPDEFYSIAKSFINRGILDKRNRFVRVVPLPLAIRLASDWWEKCSPEKAKDILTDDLPPGMAEALCDQMSKLQFLPEAQQLTKDLCGDSAPFGQAKVLNSEKGSRLFRSLAEVNPQASVEALEHVFGNCTKEQLLQVGPGRRNIILALEKLCFWEDIFPRASRIMLSFAVAENEAWANNATNQFLQLFHCLLSGTKAPPNVRLETIDEALRSNDIEYKTIAVKALGHSLMSQHFCRDAGVECQGSRFPQEDWMPKIWGDVFNYWRESLKRLTSLACKDNELAILARKQISDNLRNLVQRGFMDEIEAALNQICIESGVFWPDMYNRIEESIIYEGSKIPREGLDRLNKWKEMLRPRLLNEKLKLIVSSPPYSFVKDDKGHYVFLSENKTILLAKECSKNVSPLLEHLQILFEGEQKNGYIFGYTLGEKLDTPEIFIEKSLVIMKKMNPAVTNPSVLGGFLSAIKPKFPEMVENILDEISQDEKLYRHIVYLTRCIKPSQKDLIRMVELIKGNKIKVSDLGVLGVSYESPKIVISFCDDLIQFGYEGLLKAIEILYLYTMNKPEKFEACKVEMRTLLLTPGIISNFDKKSLMDEIYLSDISDSLNPFLFNTDEDSELATHVSNEIISACKNRNQHLIKLYFEPIIQGLLSKYRDISWPIFSKALLSEDWCTRDSMIHLFKSDDMINESKECILFELPPELLLEWCKENPKEAPIIIANIVPFFAKNGDSWSLHPLTKLIIDNYGNRSDILQEISSKLYYFSWIGSRIPFYETRIELLTQLLNHNIPEVRRWAKNNIEKLNDKIDYDKKREEEEEKLGIISRLTF